MLSFFCFIWMPELSLGEDNIEPATLIITHPNDKFLSALVDLVHTGNIPVPNMQVIGVYHSDEEKNYKSAKDLVQKEHIDWIKFETLKGTVPVSQLFSSNIWSEEFQRLFSISDGVIFPGGPDILPELYGRKTSLLTVISTPKRHFYEVSFLFHLIGGKRNKEFKPFLDSRPLYPVLGICLGVQTMNTAAGGTLYQDIPSEIYGLKYAEDLLEFPEKQHKNYMFFLTNDETLEYGVLHQILLKEKNPFAYHSSEMPFVSSTHHQSIEVLGENLGVWATSMDGRVIEGVYHKVFPHVVGVQFHPERQKLWGKTGVVIKGQVAEHLEHAPSVQFHQSLWKTFAAYLMRSYEAKRR